MMNLQSVNGSMGDEPGVPTRLVIVGAGAAALHYAAAMVDAGATVTVIVPRGTQLRHAHRKQLLRLGSRGVEVVYDRVLLAIHNGADESLCILADGSAYPADRVLVLDDPDDGAGVSVLPVAAAAPDDFAYAAAA
jgi:pyruvate/2-oxoglutarate dehydrogenase complex dihydrolipoamide dehydrogenase (E3) component